MTKVEKNYPVNKLEFLVLEWAVTDKYKDYLYGQHFTIITDNNQLTYVLTTAKLDATGHRRDGMLTLRHTTVTSSTDLGRPTLKLVLLTDVNISSDSVKAICNSATTPSFAECLAVA